MQHMIFISISKFFLLSNFFNHRIKPSGRIEPWSLNCSQLFFLIFYRFLFPFPKMLTSGTVSLIWKLIYFHILSVSFVETPFSSECTFSSLVCLLWKWCNILKFLKQQQKEKIHRSQLVHCIFFFFSLFLEISVVKWNESNRRRNEHLKCK